MTRSIKIALFLSISYIACSQSTSEKTVAESGVPVQIVAERIDSVKSLLTGWWMYRGAVDNEYMVECPDVLRFDSTMQYMIYNDCEMSLNNREGLIEEGSWDFSNKKIDLNNRKFLNQEFSNYVFQNADSSLVIYVKKITDKELRLCFENNGNCNISKYVRLDRKK